MTKTYLPVLDVPGNTFSIDVYKPQGRPAYVSVIEGRLKTEDFNGRKVQSFEMEIFGKDRSFRVPLEGNNTKKNRANALARALEMLEEQGLVEKGHSLNID